jgi:hypothetical protein
MQHDSDSSGSMPESGTAVAYVEAIGRNPGEERQHSHLYAVIDGDYTPMCRYGWNRSDGEGFSIFRGHRGAKGLCGICDRRRVSGLAPVHSVPGSHKTKWL